MKIYPRFSKNDVCNDGPFDHNYKLQVLNFTGKWNIALFITYFKTHWEPDLIHGTARKKQQLTNQFLDLLRAF